MSTHSPGPWRSEVCVDFQTIVDANDKTVAAVFVPESLPLLLAAPDLLKACRPLLAFLRCGCGYESCGLCHAINQAEAAIKKARGEQ